MRLKHLNILLLILPLAFVCCQRVENVPESKPVITFVRESVTVQADASDVTVMLNANCDWSASSSVSWIKVSPSTGTRATTSLTLSVEENTVEETSRQGEIILEGEGVRASMTLVQNAPAGPVPPGTELYTAEDFKVFLDMASDFTGSDITKVNADIDLGGMTITPIASYSGVFDGQGHKIYNFKVESSSETSGLILVNNGTVKNVMFGTSDGSVYDGVSQISSTDGRGGAAAGLIAVNNGTVDGVTSFVKIKFVAGEASARVGVGGIVGEAGATETGSAVITNCDNYAHIEASGTLAQESSFGGVVGHIGTGGVEVSSCTNHVDLSFDIPVKKVLMLGGVIGRCDAGSVFDNLVNDGNVSYISDEKPSTWMSVGGIVGAIYKNSKLTNSINNGQVYSNLLQVNRLGGIAGVLNTGGMIYKCINNGKVVLEQTEANANWQAAGGILGFQEKSENDKDNILSSNINNGPVEVSVKNSTTHANKIGVGGIIGEGCLSLNVTDNTNAADVTVSNEGSAAVYAGGVYGAIIKHSKAMASSGNVNSGAVTATSSDISKPMAGGIAGYIAASSGGDANKVQIVLNAEKNTGSVSCSNATMSGSIVGNNGSGKLVNCKVGGKVNGVDVSESNIAVLVQGTASKGTVEGSQVVE